jgi:hypothetical protein
LFIFLFFIEYAEEWKQSRKYGVGEVVGTEQMMEAADVGLSMGLSGTDGLCFYLIVFYCIPKCQILAIVFCK